MEGTKGRVGRGEEMVVRVKDVEKLLEKMAPPQLAESWDAVGLFFGDKEREIKKIQVSLGISPEVIEEAIENGADMIVSHHPIWLKSPLVFTEETSQGKMVAQLIRNEISVLSAHTNLDSCLGGVNDALVALLDLQEVTPLKEVTEEWLKLVVFVPLTHMESVKDVLGDAGAGQIGNYSHCSFFTQGEGSFLPLDGANPTIGVVGKTEVVSEARLEVVLAASSLKLVLEKLKEVHPYEEVAYDLYPLKNKIPSPIGMGRVGVLKNKIKLGDFAKVVKEKLNLPGLRFCGDIEQEIQKVALCGGAGMSLVQYAKNAKVDVFLTGDIKHHEAEEAMLNGVALIDGGHFGTEKVILPILVNYLEQVGKIEVYQSQGEKEIFKFK